MNKNENWRENKLKLNWNIMEKLMKMTKEYNKWLNSLTFTKVFPTAISVRSKTVKSQKSTCIFGIARTCMNKNIHTHIQTLSRSIFTHSHLPHLKKLVWHINPMSSKHLQSLQQGHWQHRWGLSEVCQQQDKWEESVSCSNPALQQRWQ